MMFSERYELRLWILFSRNSNFKAGSRLWFGVDTGQMYVIFAMDKVPRGQVFLRWLRIFPISIIPPVIRTYSFIPLACAECDDSLPFSAASSIPLCYVLFRATLLQLFFHPLLPHLAIYFLVYPSILLFPNSYTILFWEFYFLLYRGARWRSG